MLILVLYAVAWPKEQIEAAETDINITEGPIKVTSITPYEINPGTDKKIAIEIYNVASSGAIDLSVEVEFGDGLSPQKVNKKTIHINEGDHCKVEFPFVINNTAKSGIEKATFTCLVDGYSSPIEVNYYYSLKVPDNSVDTDGTRPFEPSKGYSFEEKVSPGKTTHIRTEVKSYDYRSIGVTDFDSFEIESNYDGLVVTGLKLYSSSSMSTEYYPDNNVAVNSKNWYGASNISVVEFDVSCSANLEPKDYTITLWGTHIYSTYKNSTIIDKPVKYPLIKYTITSEDVGKGSSVSIDSITYNKSKMMPLSSNSFTVKLTNSSSVDISELFLETELGTNLSPDYEMKKLRVGSLKAGATTTFKVPFTVNSNAVSGTQEVSFTATGIDKYGKDITKATETIFVKIGTGVAPVDGPSLSLSTKQNYKLLVPSTEDSVIVRITNNGSRLAKNVKLTCTKGFGVDCGLTKSYTASYITVDDIPAGKTVKVEVPFLVGSNFVKGIHELEFSAAYTDEDKTKYESDTMTMYVEHYKTGEIAEVDGLTYLLISGVTQTPNMPQAGERVTVSFNVKNKGTEKVTNLHFYATGLSAAGFQPVTGEPYQDEGSLEAGESKKVTMTFMAGEDIPKGVNSLSIGYDYFDASNKAQEDSTTIYVLNVVNHKFDEVDVGRPKIIVSDYSTEPEILRAGETFDFSYTLKNTHTGKEARNIKITLSQADGVLAPAQGTNIFYIDKLDPVQEVVLSLPLKSRADTVTGDYAVVLKLEYEYDDMSEVDKEHGGVSEENTIKIRVIENYRPVIENIYVDSYQGIMVGQPVDLSFEFYNMGKSTLGNVYVTVEGDFVLANNAAMSYVGAVQGYGQEYLSPQVVPLVGGEAHGTVTIHFEDSNGDEQTKSADFTAYVDDMGGEGDWGGGFPYGEGDWGGDFPYGEGDFPFGDGDMVDGEEGFFASIPWWVWVIAGVVVAGGVTAVVIIVVKKRKKKKEEEDEDEDI
ncbi:MAG: hypothetical protein K6F44_07770 [Lachnospiraceae bacterium]|nr:hypothetical protein [Lachnospiraceae bacterium]